MDYHAGAFTTAPGHCYRTLSIDGAGRPRLCPDPVEFKGQVEDEHGAWHKVEACVEHAADLAGWRRVGD